MAAPKLNPRYIVSANRQEKALKMRAVIEHHLKHPVMNLRMLDIGTGNGEIIDFFADGNETFGIDVEDQRVSQRSAFTQVSDEVIPHPDASFDVVISNHVIEHVQSPSRHLAEIKRVLKPQGIVYLSTPNRVFPKETHLKLWLLHYLPDSCYFHLANRLGRKADRFWIFSPWTLSRLIKCCGFKKRDYTPLILAAPERYHAANLCPIPLGKLTGHLLAPFSPTFIHVLEHS